MKKRPPAHHKLFHTVLGPELAAVKKEIEGYARGYGLDFFEVIFEVLDWQQLNEVAAYGGFPNRYPHWRFGMEFEELSKSYAYGLSKIYEMVINNDPCYAYLLHSNPLVDQKLVMGHVYAHCDFFKNNVYFSHTNRKMMDEMANHRTRVVRFIERYGHDAVERFIDACLSLDTLIDYHAPAIRRRRPPREAAMEDDERAPLYKLRAERPYMEKFVNPPDFLAAQRERQSEEESRERHFPESPERDVLLFLLEHAPLERWERDVLSIVREEVYYFAPQGQTKILNEGWACVVPGTLISTDHGLIPIERIVNDFLPVLVHDGRQTQHVTDYARFARRKTVKVRTRRGYEIEGSTTHQILLADGTTWRRLDALRSGDEVAIGRPEGLWPDQHVTIDWEIRRRLTLEDVAEAAQVNLSTVLRHRSGECVSRSATDLALPLATYDAQYASLSFMQNSRKPIVVPELVDENLAAFLGYLVGDGHVSRVKRVIGLTTGDLDQAQTFVSLCRELFHLQPRIKRDGERYRVLVSSEHLRDLLVALGVKEGVSARQKIVPPSILSSPKKVVAAFLRALFDCDGYAGPHGVILSTSSTQMSKHVQLLLLHFGILSIRRPQPKDIWHVHVTGLGAKRFCETIGFGLARKQQRLQSYINDRQWFKGERWEDEIVSIEFGESEVYDMTVENTHCYVAHGFMNHNSYWHSKIMTEKALSDAEVIDYADHHSGTVATQPGRLNPYKLGLELLRDVEERWNKGRFGKAYAECTDMTEKRRWDTKLGTGRQKIFEVRRLYNDVTFIDEYLTPEFCAEHKLFTFAFNPSADQFELTSREFDKVKKQLLFQLTNFGKPIISVTDGNYRNRGELLLKHNHEGIDLQLDEARETLTSLFRLWRRPVAIETMVDGIHKILMYDGQQHSEIRP